jgi:hypothetical protein
MFFIDLIIHLENHTSLVLERMDLELVGQVYYMIAQEYSCKSSNVRHVLQLVGQIIGGT